MAVLRWIMQLDRPSPVLSDAEISAKLEADYTWNFVVNLMDGGFFFFGYSFVTASTILPLFLSKLTTSPLPFALLAVFAAGGWALPQLFTANIVERLPRMKPIVVNLGLFFERLPIFVFVLAALVAGRFPLLAIVLLIGAFAWHVIGAGLVAISWQNMIARCFPVNRRGRLLGMQSLLGAGTGAAGAGFSAWLLQAFPFPTNFVYTFGIAAVTIMISWFWLALTREPAQVVTASRRGIGEYLSQLPALFRADRNFRNFLLTRALMAVGGMSGGFITVSVVERWQVADSMVGLFTTVLLIGQTVGSGVIGLLADRFGHKLALQIGIGAFCLSYVMAWLAPAAAWYYAVFALQGIASGVMMVSGILMVMEFCSPEQRPIYIGVTNTGLGIVGMAAPMVGAAVAGTSYPLLFGVSTLFYGAAFLGMWALVKDPRRATVMAQPE
jgi:MFS family permease